MVRKSSDGVTAVMTIERRKTKYEATDSRNLHLVVTVDGKTILDRSLCTPLRCGIATQQTLSLHRLSGGTPDAVLDYYTGGAHCCFWSLIVAPTGKTIVHDWGDAGYKIVGYQGAPQLVSADDRFAYEFDAFAFSGLPLLIERFSNGGFVDVTSSYPNLVAADAHSWYAAYQSGIKSHTGLGALAAWAADEDTLGNPKLVARVLARELRHGHLRSDGGAPWKGGKAFVAELQTFLKRTGYR